MATTDTPEHTTDRTTVPTSDSLRLPGADLVNRGLDRLEDGLPALPAAVVRAQRSVAERIADQSRDALCAVGDAIGSTVSVGRHAARTVTGTARHAGRETTSAADEGLHRTMGQARAGTSRTAAATREAVDTIGAESRELADDAVATATEIAQEVAATAAATAHGSPVAYERWTKRELYEVARDLDIDGRSSMSKDELIDAIEQAR